MKKIFPGLLAGLVLGALATWWVQRSATGSANAETAAVPAEKPKQKENPLHLPPAKRAAAGIVLAKPVSVTLTPEVTAFGRVLDAAPFVALAAESEISRAALAASAKELARLEKLFAADTNVSAQAVETATATVARDRLTVGAARAKLLAAWGRPLADLAGSAFTESSIEHDAALVRIDLLPGDTPAADLKKIKVGLLGGNDRFDADLLGPAPVADAQLSGPSFVAVVHFHALPTGAALRATLPGAGETQTSLVVPRSAIVYHEGSAWLYVLEEEDTFERKLVTVGRSLGDTVAISGLEDSHQIVTAGAQQLLSAELQAGGAPAEG